MKRKGTAIAVCMGFCLALPAAAQLSYPGCDELRSEDFEATELFNKSGSSGAAEASGLSEPVQMDVRTIPQSDGTFQVQVYLVERLGKVKLYDGAAQKVTEMGSISVWGKADNGLMGLALHPNFEENRWIYFWYSPDKLSGDNRLLRLTRITVTPDNKLDMASEKILIEILGSKTDNWHSGGPMTFDAYGDLWVTVGNNSRDLIPGELNVLSHSDSTHSAEWGSSSTANLRGGVFRIHPDSSEKGYRIPAGNFGEYWADEFERKGRTDLAAEYRNPAKVLPEVYVKGTRSNYSIAVHPTKRWLAWGEVNYSNKYDEFNLTAHPMFGGYPYFHAKNERTGNHDISAEAPKNTSPFNSGVTELPPAVPAPLVNLTNISMGGPIYAFDHHLVSEVKFPPHFHHKWLGFGFNTNQIWLMDIDSNQVEVRDHQRIDGGLFSNIRIRRVTMAKYGGDGALYILNYDGFYNAKNPGVMRVVYKGGCRPAVSVAERDAPGRGLAVHGIGNRLVVREPGRHVFALHDLSGKRLLLREGGRGASYSLTALEEDLALKQGVYVLQVETAAGLYTRNVFLGGR